MQQAPGTKVEILAKNRKFYLKFENALLSILLHQVGALKFFSYKKEPSKTGVKAKSPRK
jgi:hypothetical protein